MVRSGDDVLVIDRCVRRRHRMPPPGNGYSDDFAPVMSVMLYLNDRLTPGTRVHQLADGRKYIVSHLYGRVRLAESGFGFTVSKPVSDSVKESIRLTNLQPGADSV